MSWFRRHSDPLWLLAGFTAVLFFFIYSINFTFLPTFTSRLISLAVIAAAGWWFLHRGEFEFTVDRSIRIIFSLWFFLLIWVLYRTLVTEFADPGWFVNTFLILVQVFTGCVFFAWWIYRRGYSFRFMIRLIQVCIVVQAVFIIIYFFSWEFKEFTLLIIPEGGNIPALHPYRSRGLTHHASASLAAFQASGLLLTGYLIIKARHWREMFFDLVAAGLLIGSVFLTGRTGFLVLPILFFFFFLYFWITRRISRKVLTYTVVLPGVLVAGFLAMEFIYVQIGGWAAPWGGGDAFRSMTNWTFQEYEDLLTEGRSRTTDVLVREHLFWPDEAGVLALGDPTTYAVNRVRSDIGVVRRVFGLGVIGAVLTYLFVVAILFHSWRRSDDVAERLLIVLFGVWIFVLELKEPFVTDFRFATIYLMIFAYLCLMPLQNSSRIRMSDHSGHPPEDDSRSDPSGSGG